MVVPAHSTSPQPPQIGTQIDSGALELVEILGYGGYGVVYRAIDVYSSHPTSYAVKCLPHSTKRNAARQRQLHIREITLHQLASRHPGVVTLHRVIEDQHYTWIVMDYCPDGDLFTQILHNRRYLGNNDLIKNVFLQLLDAVDFCHSMSIYHRDLKPENVLCFDDGLRLAITDFGLATTDKMSTEFRTGSVYHMSPECQGGEFSPTKSYSPLFNDIWSLGIILLNLITGRNPWKSASAEDCTFQAYLRDPAHFLPTVLPISQEVNALLVRTLEVDWRRRITLRDMRQELLSINNFYSKDVLFEDSMARCPWEAGVNVDEDEDSVSTEPEPVQEVIPEPQPEVDLEAHDFHDAAETARWGADTDSEMVFAAQPTASEAYSWYDGSSYAKTDAAHTPARSLSPSPSLYSPRRRRYDDMRTPSGPSLYSLVSSSPSIPSPPVTPGPDDVFFVNAPRRPAHLTLDINGLQNDYYGNVDMLSARSSVMQTALESAIEYNPYASYYVEESEKMVISPQEGGMMATPTEYEFDEEEMDGMDALSAYSYPTIDAYDTIGMAEDTMARPESPVLGLDLGFPSSEASAGNEAQSPFHWSTEPAQPSSTQATPAFSFLAFPSSSNSLSQVPASSFQSTPEASRIHDFETTLGSSFLLPPPASTSTPNQSHGRSGSRSRSSSRKSRLLNPVRLAFTRRSRSPSPSSFLAEPSGNQAIPESHTTQPQQQQQFVTHWTLSTSISPEHPPSLSCFASPAPSPARTPPTGSATSTSVQEKNAAGMRRRVTKRKLRSAKDWFSPGRLFAAVMPSP